MLLGWIAFIVGIAQNYMLAEGGDRLFHGNFRWSGQIALFLLFAITLRWMLREKILTNLATRWEKIGSLVIYNAHLMGGIAYYIYCIISPHYG
jgi:ABC-type transport system involved in cytochrome bd biosynthesis fused ATPase/permease subunit